MVTYIAIGISILSVSYIAYLKVQERRNKAILEALLARLEQERDIIFADLDKLTLGLQKSTDEEVQTKGFTNMGKSYLGKN